MEARVAILETHVEYIRQDIGDLKADVSGVRRDLGQFKDHTHTDFEGVKVQLATLTERVNHLPSKGFIVSATLSSLAIISALIIFQDHIKALFAH